VNLLKAKNPPAGWIAHYNQRHCNELVVTRMMNEMGDWRCRFGGGHLS